MGKTSDNETGASASAAAPAASKVIRAVPGQPWPEPPHGGRWSRDGKTGDLTLIETTGELSVQERAAAKAARQAAQNTTKE